MANQLEYGLIGYPLGHSFSAAFFAEKFKKEGIDARYRNFPMEKADGLKGLLEREPGLCGLNVTVPHKKQVMDYLHRIDPVAAEVGAVNTVVIGKGGVLAGFNTDVIGFEQSLMEHVDVLPSEALVLGTGGSSGAVVYVLKKLGIPFTMVSRSSGADRISYDSLDEGLVRNCHLIVNTTPLGMYPRVHAAPPLPYPVLGKAHLLFDLVYNPPLTRFLQEGKERGSRVVNGHDMLRYQAEASWRIWQREREI